ncbi:MAG: hypothetical protein PHO10_00245 [Gemmiger sp.]|nr:hypothetical protein [Gemmiger sp.]
MEITQIPQEVLSFAELKEDPSYPRIPPEQRALYLTTAQRAGQRAAQTYAGQDLEAILTRGGVAVRRFSDSAGGDLHSQILYDGTHRQVDLFLPMAEKLSAAMAKTPCPIPPKKVEAMFLAHEFYHYLEYASGHRTEEQCPPVQKRFLGIFSVQNRVCRMSEIAAFAFSKAFCHAEVAPKAMDYMLICCRENRSYADFCVWMDRLQAECKAACGGLPKGEAI